ncbi:unnamed protein product [Angiostrongylus costaricensis]|uniref:SH3 domain-containing protein n=1 Tax=Angiostrongylus costaricensis TaxID=334426 RepID=A0A0R3PM69_ANGCS|nr:unnamed protein product [Angiostrongylus costaricensis]
MQRYLQLHKKDGSWSDSCRFEYVRSSIKSELPLNRGDIIRVRREVDVNWLEGERNGQCGLFPRSYVQPTGQHFIIIDTRPLDQTGDANGEVVTIRREIDENWYEGTNHLGEIGIFPRNYVRSLLSKCKFQILTNSPDRPKTPKVFERDEHFSRPNSYRALYKFTPTKSDEVSLEVNDIIFVVEKCDDGWYIEMPHAFDFIKHRLEVIGCIPGLYIN